MMSVGLVVAIPSESTWWAPATIWPVDRSGDKGFRMQPDDTLCYCFHVSLRKVRNFIRVERPRRASQLSACGGAGTGCGWCVRFLERCFQESQANALNEFAEVTSVAAATYAQQRAAYIRDGRGTPTANAVPLPTEGTDADTATLTNEVPPSSGPPAGGTG